MFTLTPESLAGVWCPVLVPVDEDDQFDADALGDELRYLAKSGVTGLFLDATSAPWPRLGHLDVKEVLDEAAGIGFTLGLPVVAADELIDVRAALELGASAPLVDVRPGDVGECVRLALAAEPSGIVIDGRGAGSWSPAQLREALAATPFVGYVQGAPDPDELEGIRDLEDRVGVLAPPEVGHAAWRWGASGTCGALVALSPAGFADAWARVETDGRDLARLELRLQRFVEVALAPMRRHGHTPGDLTRHLAAAGGWCPPLGPVDERIVEGLAEHASELLPELVD